MAQSSQTLKDNGNLYYKSGEYKKARDAYIKCIQLKPADQSLHYNLAMALFQLQKYEESLKSSVKALELDPKYEKALYRKFQCNLKLGNNLQAIMDGKKYLGLEVSTESFRAQVRQNITDLKAKLLQSPAPSPAPPNLSLFSQKHPTLPRHITQIPCTLKYDSVGLLYLREMLRQVLTECNISYSSSCVSQLEEIKKLLYRRLLEEETDQNNKIDILEILTNTSAEKKEKEQWLEDRIAIAIKNGWEDKALTALRELAEVSGESKKVDERIQRMGVKGISEDEEEKEEEKEDLNGIISNGKKSTRTKATEDSSKSLPIKKSISIEESQPQAVGNPQQSKTQAAPVKKPEPPLKSGKKQENKSQSNSTTISDMKSQQTDQDVLEKQIAKKTKSLAKFGKFEEFVDILQKASDLPPAKRQSVLLQLTKISKFSILLTGLNKSEQSQLHRITKNMSEQIKKLYRVDF